MAHVFDYSVSRLAVTGTSVDDLMFGRFYGATAFPAEYWVGNGGLNGSIRWWETDYSTNPYRDYVVSGRTLVDAYGNDQVAGPGDAFFPVESAASHQNEAPAAYFAEAGNLVLSSVFEGYSYGSYLAFSNIAAPVRTLGAHPLAPYASYGDAGWGLRRLAEQANADYVADLVAIGETSLADAGVITVRQWDDRPARGDDFVLTYTPDADTRLLVGDLVDFGIPNTTGYGQILPHADIFRGEDVTLIMTDGADQLFLNTLPARLLTIRMGGGDDYLTLGNDTAGTGGFGHLPLAQSVHGGAGNDSINLSAALQTTLSGGNGDDYLYVTGSRPSARALVTILGGQGNDTLSADQTKSNMYGGAGDDLVTGGTRSDTMHGGSGNDFLSDLVVSGRGSSRYFGASNVFFGDDGDDDIWGGAGDDSLDGGAGSDTIWGGLGDDILAGGAGRDVFEWGTTYRGLNVPLGDDVLIDSGGLISISDFSPYFTIGANLMIRVGQDLLIGEVGVSSLRITGFYDNPTAWSGARDQGLGPLRDATVIDLAAARALTQTARLGTDADDRLQLTAAGSVAGMAGHDTLDGSAGGDLAFGDGGDDRLNGRDGRDRLFGGEGNDMLDGGKSADLLAGNQGNDRLVGGRNADTLSGGGGKDTLLGGDGNDRVIGGAGNDVLTGGKGADRFEFGMDSEADRIADFTRGDQIIISSSLFAGLPNPGNVSPASVVQLFGTIVDGSLVLDFGFGDSITLTDITNRALVAAALQFDTF